MKNYNSNKSILNKKKSILTLSTAIMLSLTAANSANALNYVWLGTGGDNLWTNNQNWSVAGNTPNTTNDEARYQANSIGGILIQNVDPNILTFSIEDMKDTAPVEFRFEDTLFRVRNFLAAQQTGEDVTLNFTKGATIIVSGSIALNSKTLTRMNITNGAQFQDTSPDPAKALISTDNDTKAEINVSGVNSKYAGRSMVLSTDGTSSLLVDDQGEFKIDSLVTSAGANGESSIKIQNNGSFTAQKVDFAKAGTSQLVVSTNGKFTAGDFNAAELAGSKADIIIGSAPDEAASAPGIFAVDKINFGAGEGNIIFNHTDQNGYSFDTEISGKTNINLMSGKTIFKNDLTILGQTRIDNTATMFLGSATSPIQYNGDILTGTGGALAGFGRIKNLINNGTISPGSDDKFGTLTVDGNYQGRAGSNILIKTALFNDSSATDLLHITGNSTGESTVTVVNTGGTGAQTNEGIKVIEIDGQSDAVFTLNGNYVTEAGNQAVIAGAYAYELKKNGISTPDDGDWYLRSEITDCPVTPPKPDPTPGPGPKPGPTPTPQPAPFAPCFQPGVPLYTAEAQIISMMNRDSYTSLEERVGDRFWSGSAAYVIPQGADPIIYEDMGADTQAITDVGLVWLKASASYDKYQLLNTMANHVYEQDSYRIRAGLDNQFYEGENGIAVWGLWGQFATADARVTASFGSGTIDINNYGIGGALTWYGENGFYLDAQTQVNWYYSKLHSSTLDRTLIDDHRSMGYGASLEAGKRIQYNQHWSFTPQAQLIYSSVDQDNYVDAFQTHVRTSGLNTLTGRVGISANYETAWQADNGTTSRMDIRALVSLMKNGLSDKDRVFVGDVDIKTGLKETLWSELGLGTTYSWNDGKYALYGNVKTRLAFEDVSNNYSITGNAGIRIKW